MGGTWFVCYSSEGCTEGYNTFLFLWYIVDVACLTASHPTSIISWMQLSLMMMVS